MKNLINAGALLSLMTACVPLPPAVQVPFAVVCGGTEHCNPGAPRCKPSVEDGPIVCPKMNDKEGVWYAGRDGFMQRPFYVTNVRITSR